MRTFAGSTSGLESPAGGALFLPHAPFVQERGLRVGETRRGTMKHRTAWTVLAAGLAASVATSAQGSNPGEVLYEQKISPLSGGFGGTLGTDNYWGISAACLDDLDG